MANDLPQENLGMNLRLDDLNVHTLLFDDLLLDGAHQDEVFDDQV